MYPNQKKIIKKFTAKFSSSIYGIEKFLRKHRIYDGPETTMCGINQHQLKPGMTIYAYNGNPHNLKSHYCHDIFCFLSGLDHNTISAYLKKTSNNTKQKNKTKTSNKQTLPNTLPSLSKTHTPHTKDSNGHWFCHTCDLEITQHSDINSCKGNNHQLVWYRKDNPTSNNDNNEKTHTEYALDIMDTYKFVTLEDTDEVLVHNDGVYKYGGEVIIKEEAERRVEHCSTFMRKEIINTIKVRTYRRRDIFDLDPLILNVKNGLINLKPFINELSHNTTPMIPLVNLKKIELEPHTSYHLSRIQLDVSYDPDASPQKFIKFMSEILTDYKDRLLIYELFASALLRDSLNLEKCLMFVGEGANGKSTLLKVLTQVFGTSITSHVSIHDLIYNRFSRSVLDGKLLNIYTDISNDELDRMGFIKALISGDPITVEKKNKPQYTMINVARMFFSCNRLPEINEDSDAIFRRFSIVHFLEQFKGKRNNVQLYKELTSEEEKSGILNLLLIHAVRLLCRRTLSYDISTNQLRREWKERADPIQNFASMCLKKSNDNYAIKSDTYHEYVQFCKDRDLLPTSERTFSDRLKRLGYVGTFKKILKRTTRVWSDVELVRHSGYKMKDKKIDSDGSVTSSTKNITNLDKDNKRINKTQNDKKLDSDIWFKCITCNTIPYNMNSVDSNGISIYEIHSKQQHHIIKCTKDGEPLPDDT